MILSKARTYRPITYVYAQRLLNEYNTNLLILQNYGSVRAK